jgi:hypothetical protein
MVEANNCRLVMCFFIKKFILKNTIGIITKGNKDKKDIALEDDTVI